MVVLILMGNRDNFAGVGTKLRAARSGVSIPVGARDCVVLRNVQTGSVGPPRLLFNAYRGSFPRAKRLRLEVYLSPPSSARFKNEWSHTSASRVCFYGMDRERFAFYL
jgi:hypothetical protein